MDNETTAEASRVVRVVIRTVFEIHSKTVNEMLYKYRNTARYGASVACSFDQSKHRFILEGKANELEYAYADLLTMIRKTTVREPNVPLPSSTKEAALLTVKFARINPPAVRWDSILPEQGDGRNVDPESTSQQSIAFKSSIKYSNFEDRTVHFAARGAWDLSIPKEEFSALMMLDTPENLPAQIAEACNCVHYVDAEQRSIKIGGNCQTDVQLALSKLATVYDVYKRSFKPLRNFAPVVRGKRKFEFKFIPLRKQQDRLASTHFPPRAKWAGHEIGGLTCLRVLDFVPSTGKYIPSRIETMPIARAKEFRSDTWTATNLATFRPKEEFDLVGSNSGTCSKSNRAVPLGEVIRADEKVTVYQPLQQTPSSSDPGTPRNLGTRRSRTRPDEVVSRDVPTTLENQRLRSSLRSGGIPYDSPADPKANTGSEPVYGVGEGAGGLRLGARPQAVVEPAEPVRMTRKPRERKPKTVPEEKLQLVSEPESRKSHHAMRQEAPRIASIADEGDYSKALQRQNMKMMADVFEQALEHARSFRGHLELKLRFGRILFDNLPSHLSKNQIHWGELGTGLERATGKFETVFTPILTKDAYEADFVTNLKMSGGRELFQRQASKVDIVCEIQCVENGRKFTISIDMTKSTDKSRVYTVYGEKTLLADTLMPCPQWSWDARLELKGRSKVKVSTATKKLINSLSFSADELYPEFHFTVDGDDFRVKAICLKQVHRHISSDHEVFLGVPMDLSVAELYPMSLQKNEHSPRMFKAHGYDVQRIKDWKYYTFTLVPTGPEHLFSQNASLGTGDKTRWVVKDILNATGNPRNNQDRSDTDNIMIKAMENVATIMLSKMDNIGFVNFDAY